MKAKIHAYAFASFFMFAGTVSAAEADAQGAVAAEAEAEQATTVQSLEQLPATAAGVELTAKARADLQRERVERRLEDTLKGNASVFGAGL